MTDFNLIKNQKNAYSSNGRLQVETEFEELTTAYADYSGAETDTLLVTAGATEKIIIHNIYVSTEVADVDVTIKLGTTTIFKLYTTKTNLVTSPQLHIIGALGEDVNITCGAGTFIAVNYHID